MKRTPMKRSTKPKRGKRCAICGIQFMPATGFQKYCGSKCRIESQMVTKECLECGSSFRRVRSNGPLKYCSHGCASRGNSKERKGRKGRFGMGSIAGYPKPGKCIGCGGVYQKKTAGAKYCTRSCAMVHRHAEKRKTLPQKWGISAKGELGCRNCGLPASHLHHIVPRSKSKMGREDVARNGVPLCRDCHYGWHHRTVEIPHMKLTDEEFAFGCALVGVQWMQRMYPDGVSEALHYTYNMMTGKTLPNSEPMEKAAEVRAEKTRHLASDVVLPWVGG